MTPASRRRSSSAVAAAELVERLLEDRDRLVEAMEVEELGSEQRGRFRLPFGIVDQPVRLLQVLGRGLAAQQRLGGAEPSSRSARSEAMGGSASPAVRDGALGSTARAGAPRGFPKHRDDARVGSRGNEQEVGGGLLGPRSGLGEETGRARVPAASLERCQLLVDRRADERMDEPERELRAKDIGARGP